MLHCANHDLEQVVRRAKKRGFFPPSGMPLDAETEGIGLEVSEPDSIVILGLVFGSKGLLSAEEEVFPPNSNVEATSAFVFVEPRQQAVAGCLQA